MPLFKLTRWPAVLVFALAGLSAVALAFVTYNLFAQAMASVDFIGRHGVTALRLGALVQLLQLGVWGAVALMAYLVFKACEVELVFRYYRWARRVPDGMAGRKALRFRREMEEDEERPDT